MEVGLGGRKLREGNVKDRRKNFGGKLIRQNVREKYIALEIILNILNL